MRILNRFWGKKKEEHYYLPEVFQAAVRTYGKDSRQGGFKILPSSPMAKTLITFFIIIDFSFIKQLTDCYFAETWWKTLASALVVAALMDIMPSIIAELAKMKCKRWYTYLEIVVSTTALLAVFIVIFVVRWYSQDILYETAFTQLQIVTAFTSEIAHAESDTAGRAAMTILFGMIPLVTSIISFFVSYHDNAFADQDNSSQKLQHLVLKAQLIHVGSSIEELENEKMRDIQGYDDANKALMLNDLNQYKKISREKARLQTELKRQNPEVLNFAASGVKGV